MDKPKSYEIEISEDKSSKNIKVDKHNQSNNSIMDGVRSLNIMGRTPTISVSPISPQSPNRWDN
jgi:hypothetical protein